MNACGWNTDGNHCQLFSRQNKYYKSSDRLTKNANTHLLGRYSPTVPGCIQILDLGSKEFLTCQSEIFVTKTNLEEIT